LYAGDKGVDVSEKTDRFGTVRPEVIADGDATDAYFNRTVEALSGGDRNPHVVASVSADQFSDGDGEVLVGVNRVAELLSDVPVDMYALPEGASFDGGPVMRIEGNYQDFARYETALLGMLSEPSGYATKARALVEAADGTPVLSFGSRHNHPATAAVMERAAYIGGVDGYSNEAAVDEVPIGPSGTMPHALMLACWFGRSRDSRSLAWELFDAHTGESVPNTVLADTWDDEVSEVMHAVSVLGDDLDGVRLDTTGSRRGDFEAIIREVRYELEQAERDDVDIVVSGGLGVEELEQLNGLVDGFGVGSAISDAPSVDFGLDIVQVEGEDVSKRGKLPGVKDVDMLQYVDDGMVVRQTPTISARRREYLESDN
jgi:nicotinate phosphoribosyltransferase